MVLLFSSDYYNIFKQDIFSVASLPSYFSYHFRYEPNNVSNIIREKPASFQNSMAMIIFVHNNRKTNDNLKFVPIRLAKIKSIVFEKDTGLYHAYFELREFIKLKEHVEGFEERPQPFYLANKTCEPKYEFCTWFNVIQRLKVHVNESVFFYLRVFDAEKQFLPFYDEISKESFFKILEGQTYTLKLSIFDQDSSTGKNYIETEISGNNLQSNITGIIKTGVKLDDRYFRISGGILSDEDSPSNVLRIGAVNGNSPQHQIGEPIWKRKRGTPKNVLNYEIDLLFDVKKNPNRSWNYLLASFFFFLGGGLVTTGRFLTENKSTVVFLVILGVLVASFSASRLFFLFNKK